MPRQACCIQAATTRSIMWFPSVCTEGNCTFALAANPIGTRSEILSDKLWYNRRYFLGKLNWKYTLKGGGNPYVRIAEH